MFTLNEAATLWNRTTGGELSNLLKLKMLDQCQGGRQRLLPRLSPSSCALLLFAVNGKKTQVKRGTWVEQELTYTVMLK